MQLTSSVERFAVRKPPLTELVDAQIDAMRSHAIRHGAGDLDPRFARDGNGVVDAELARLEDAGARLAPNLGLESGPRELGKIAVQTLSAKLGDDARYRDATRDSGLRHPEVLPEIEDGIGVLSLGDVDAASSGRAFGVLSAWAALDPRPRAILLDLAECEIDSAATASALVDAFAPGARAFAVVFRNAESGELERRSWGGESRWGSDAFARTDLFVVTSERTGALAEAVAHALRVHRNARILGAPTPGAGRLMSWSELPWNAWFGFTVADLMGPGGEPLRGKPVLPDACAIDGALVPLDPALPDARERCRPGTPVTKHVALDYVRAALPPLAAPAAPAATSAPGTPARK